MPIQQIDSPQNPAVRAAAKLRTSRGRSQQQRIIIDGQREIERALAGQVRIEQLFFPTSVTEPAQLFDSCPADRFVVSERAFGKIAFGNRHEVVAVAERPNRQLEDIALGKVPRIAVLEHIEKPGNLGAIMRSADGAGMDAVIAVESQCDPFNPNSVRASLGTVFTLQVVTTTFAAYAEWAERHQMTHFLSKCDGAAIYYEVDFTVPAAIVMGSEALGLQLPWESLQHQSVMLPMNGLADSLNVSAAATVLFYESAKQRAAAVRQAART